MERLYVSMAFFLSSIEIDTVTNTLMSFVRRIRLVDDQRVR